MSELHFESLLSLEEIEENFKKQDPFEEIMSGFEEALEFEKGTASSETISRKRALPVVDVYKVRASLNMTQKSFAEVLGVSTRTVEAWECGKSNPTPTAKKLIYLVKEDNTLIEKLKPKE
ncbi:MAG: helix-turn-helix domain-containing protein [Ruminococcaceae bacterium]|nr:helix-turn-helix domain-containing protein [Oscillospiraceae bacterium]